MIPVRTKWIPHARRKRIKLTQDQKRIAHRQAAQVRLLAAAAVREITPLWRKHVVAPIISGELERKRKDAIDEDELDGVDPEPIISWFVEHGQRIARTQTQMQRSLGRGLGIKPSQQSARVQTALVKARQDAQALIKKATKDFRNDVKAVIGDPANMGVRVEELRDMLLARGNVSESRATLIARDQTYKTNAAITRAHHEDAGITSYVWSTSLDERVRPEHQDLEGQIFQYSAPPDEGNPGDPINCRCVAVPYDEDDKPSSEQEDEDETAD